MFVLEEVFFLQWRLVAYFRLCKAVVFWVIQNNLSEAATVCTSHHQASTSSCVFIYCSFSNLFLSFLPAAAAAVAAAAAAAAAVVDAAVVLGSKCSSVKKRLTVLSILLVLCHQKLN